MTIQTKTTAIIALAAVFLIAGGCVERRLTIDTAPRGALVSLNDEQIGLSPVTVDFSWYGDYQVRLSKEGYETLNTHRMLKPPRHDYFPFDFFAQILHPGLIEDSYKWHFNLTAKEFPSREKLIENAEELKEQLK